MRIWLEQQEITGLCTRTVIERSIDAAGAEAEISLVCAPMDSRLPRLDPACGQWVKVEQEGATLFSGRVERVSYDAAALSLNLLCFDPASLLAKNHCRGTYQGTPEAITRQLCRECGLVPGNIWAGEQGWVVLKGICGTRCYRVIRNLYGDRCTLEFQDGKVHLYPKGHTRAVLESGRLVGLTARNTAESVVNRVEVYSGSYLLAQADDEDSIRQVGPRCRTEYLSREYQTAQEQARAGLKTVARQARLTLTGRSAVKCGQVVTLDKPLMGVYGDYQVTQVVWVWEKGLTTTELGVESL